MVQNHLTTGLVGEDDLAVLLAGAAAGGDRGTASGAGRAGQGQNQGQDQSCRAGEKSVLQSQSLLKYNQVQ